MMKIRYLFLRSLVTKFRFFPKLVILLLNLVLKELIMDNSKFLEKWQFIMEKYLFVMPKTTKYKFSHRKRINFGNYNITIIIMNYFNSNTHPQKISVKFHIV